MFLDFVLFLKSNPMLGISKCHVQSQVLFKTVQETDMNVTLTADALQHLRKTLRLICLVSLKKLPVLL